MPRSAILSGFVDCVLLPRGLRGKLVRLSRHPYVMLVPEAQTRSGHPERQTSSTRSLSCCATHTGVDFTDYKHTTIRRRIQRRMLLHQIDRIGSVRCSFSNNTPTRWRPYTGPAHQCDQLLPRPRLISGVCEKKCFPACSRIVAGSASARLGAGCSTARKRISIAITLLESIGDRRTEIPSRSSRLISRAAIEKAGRGLPQEHRAGSSAERLRRFFVKVGPWLPDQESGPRGVCVRPAKRGQRSTVLQAGSHQLSQRNDLSGTGVAEEAAADFPLRPQTRWSSHAGFLGNHRRVLRSVCSVDKKEKIYSKKPGRFLQCCASHDPSARADNAEGGARAARSCPSCPASTRKRIA